MGEGGVAVEICGQQVSCLDPTMCLKPKTINLAVSAAAAVGGVLFLSSLMCLPAAGFLCPLGMVSMLAAAIVEFSWKSLAVRERSKFAKELQRVSRPTTG